MYCLVDFLNRPLLQYTFPSRKNAKEYLQKIKNNPLGVTATFRDGRREYFESGLTKDFPLLRDKIFKIEKGCHIKYRLQELNTLDGLRSGRPQDHAHGAFARWKLFDSWPLFMLGNRKLYSCLVILIIAFFSSTWFFQQKYSSALSTGNDSSSNGVVLGASIEKTGNEGTGEQDAIKLADEDVIFNLLGKIEEQKHEEFEKEILKYIKGRPMEAMAPYIARQPRTVAAFIVGIAMKESKFGVYAPHSGGRDCFNYWGYRGSENTTTSGYSCFNSPEHAIQVIGKKINSLVARGISNPAEMISWKCGSSCAGHGAENVRKWISDVGIHFYKLNS